MSLLPEISLGLRALRSNFHRLDMPFKLTFAVTYGCNSGCVFCEIWKKTPKGELELDEIQKLFQRSPGFVWADIVGGEPFMRPDLVDITASLIENNPDLVLLHIPSNGLSPDRIERGVREILRSQRPRRFIMTVSVDAPPDLNVFLRGHPEAWTAALETFRRLRALKKSHPNFDVVIGSTISESNTDLLEELYSALQTEVPGVDRKEVHLNLAQQSDHFYANDVEAADERMVDAFESWQKHIRPSIHPVHVLEALYRAEVRSFVKTGQTPMVCKSLWNSAFLSPTGDLYPCITWDRPLGNLRDFDYDFRALWRSSEVVSAAADVAASRCPQCWTPCEAYQTILGNALVELPKVLKRSIGKRDQPARV